MSKVGTTPKIGVLGLAYPGYNLGEEMVSTKFEEMLGYLGQHPLEITTFPTPVLDTAGAREAGQHLAAEKVDCILAVITTFVPDYFIVQLLDQCDVPIFLWAVERELQCISLVCGPLITATLFNLGKHYKLVAADIPDEATLNELLVFARAAMLRRVLRTMRVGYSAGKPPIMFSMSTDEFALKRQLGTTVVNIPVEDFYRTAERVTETQAAECWRGIEASVGEVCVSEKDGQMCAGYYLAARELVEEYQLDALSLNCLPSLKSKTCLAVARLNDAGIAAACEGDLHSTILMHLLHCLSERASFNGDLMRLYPEDNEILFSHCGAGAFSLADRPSDIRLQPSIETNDGLAICYATQMSGPVTLINLIQGPDSLRFAVLCGQGVDTDLDYEGTPLRVRFGEDVRVVLQRVARAGAGHHWNGTQDSVLEELRLLCEWLGVPLNELSGHRT